VGIYWKTKNAPGSATEPDHKDWIKLNGLSFDTSRTVTTRTGRVADRVANTGSMGEVQVAKDMDGASPNLFMYTCLGKGEDMEIHVTRAGSGDDKGEIVYLKYKLENALVTGYAFNSSGANPSETLTINFTKMTKTHTPQDTSLTGASPNTVWFNAADGTSEGL
jgi:type VI secretion system secreted protein Hcp